MYKEFPSSRVCAIDYYPCFIEAVKEVYNFCKKYSIPFKTGGSGSKDIQKFFYHYCLEKLCAEYKNCKSKYPKAIVVYPLPKNVLFNDKNLIQILKVLPVPWVKCSSFESPDVEMAVTRVINSNKHNNSKLLKFTDKHALYNFLKDFKKSKTFSLGTVDLSPKPE
jgi:hypothetical protein